MNQALSVKKNIDQSSDTSDLVPDILDSYNVKWEEWLVDLLIHHHNYMRHRALSVKQKLAFFLMALAGTSYAQLFKWGHSILYCMLKTLSMQRTANIVSVALCRSPRRACTRCTGSAFTIFYANFWLFANEHLSNLSSKRNFIITEFVIFAKESHLSNQILQYKSLSAVKFDFLRGTGAGSS